MAARPARGMSGGGVGGGGPAISDGLDNFISACAGSIGAGTSTLMLFPLDVIKVSRVGAAGLAGMEAVSTCCVTKPHPYHLGDGFPRWLSSTSTGLRSVYTHPVLSCPRLNFPFPFRFRFPLSPFRFPLYAFRFPIFIKKTSDSCAGGWLHWR